MIKRLYSSIHIALLENFEQMTIRFNQYCLLTKYWSKDNTFQTTESSKKVLNKKNSWAHIVFLENFDQETIWFNPYSILRNFWGKWFNLVQFGSILYSHFGKIWSKVYQDESILPLLKTLSKWQYGSTNIVFMQNIDQKIMGLNPWSVLRTF